MMYRQVCMGAARWEKYHDSDERAWVAYGDVMDEDTHGWNGSVALRPEILDKPLHWRKPRRIFVCSMGDLFHPAVPVEYQMRVINVTQKCKQHTLLILTKRIQRMAIFFRECYKMLNGWPEEHRPQTPFKNIHLGVSVCTQAEADEKIPILLQIPAAVRFVSLEPLLGEMDLLGDEENPGPIFKMTGGQTRPNTVHGPAEWDSWPEDMIDWVIIGCESINGRAGRFADGFIDAAINLVSQCKAADVPVFNARPPMCRYSSNRYQSTAKSVRQWPNGPKN
jgi:protein gp37